jgi:hypothetical protein
MRELIIRVFAESYEQVEDALAQASIYDVNLLKDKIPEGGE